MNDSDRERFEADPKAQLMDEDPSAANDELSDDDLEEAAGGWTGDPGDGG